MPKRAFVPMEIFQTIYSAKNIEKRILKAVELGTIKDISDELSSVLVELRTVNELAKSDIKKVLREEEPPCNICKYDNSSYCRAWYSEGWCKCHAVWRGVKDNEDK
jgi:hypothetical protein